jgi:hypothetical protein
MLYKFPFLDNNDLFEKNQAEINIFDTELNKKNTENKVIVYGTKRSSLKKWEHFIKSIFRSLFKIIAVYLLNNEKNNNYVAFIIHGGLGDKVRGRSAVESLLKMFPTNTIVDIYDTKSRVVFKGVPIRFFLYIEIWPITKNKYDVIYMLSSNSAEILYAKPGKALVDAILKNVARACSHYYQI